MVELKILSEEMAGPIKVRHFPFAVGRAAGTDLHLEAAGVWDRHVQLDFDPAQGFVLNTLGDALATVNGWPVQSVLLRNGDTIALGSVKLQFWLSPTRQSGLRIWGMWVWAALFGILVAEIGLLAWLP